MTMQHSLFLALGLLVSMGGVAASIVFVRVAAGRMR